MHSTHVGQETPTPNQKQTSASHPKPNLLTLQLVACIMMSTPVNLDLSNSAYPGM